MCNSGYFLSYVDGLGTSYARSFLASTNARFYMELDREILTAILKKLSTRLPWFADIYKRKLPSTLQATNEVMFLSWSPDGKIHFSVVHLYRNSNECTCQKCVWI